MTLEVNIDGLVGPTHNYAGLSLGNRASMGNAGTVSSPRTAALQGLAKMRQLHRLGLVQGVMPPQQRPDPDILRRLGFAAAASIADVARDHPELVPFVLSASSMWAANAATVTPSIDAADGRVHFTPANLSSTTHRSFEHAQTQRTLTAMFGADDAFVVHDALPSASPFADEGAANHGRFCTTHGSPGTHLFVFGRDADDRPNAGQFPRRQTRLAGELISRSHGHDPARVVFARQASTAIDAGAFHNDVVSVVNEGVLFTHAGAFEDPGAVYASLGDVQVVEVAEAAVPIADAISSYLFNSQLVTLPDGSMSLIAPIEVEETASTAAYLAAAVSDPDHPIASVHALDLRESMRNGGGPACLRLRVVMNDAELGAMNQNVIVDDKRIDELEAWVRRHYRDELEIDDFLDPELEVETTTALDELTRMLDLGSIYPFQR
jgi:succinylarginine dihydrolase